ncbi:DUF3993 domain-containing protein [Peribacillus alkalitolerans]|uniref:DUF3993 domain-containing protein n=1 Tax=Peribacillus alkalitolerans TaxID=1550385 RepID=UPI0013D6061E|nr:DUF3993 domain-containing protein [Peribacillus alkalitolerans]
MGKYTAKILLSASLLLYTGSVAGAETIHSDVFSKKSEVKATKHANASRVELFELMEKALDNQLSFGEKTYSTEDINTIMKPYFSQRFIGKFISENMIEFDKGQFGILGSDFAPNMIPNFSYNEKTEVIEEDENVVAITEYFETVEDAPVTYKGHKEGVKLIKEAGVWKVDEVNYEWNKDKIKEEFSFEDAILQEGTEYVETVIPSKNDAVTLTSFFSWKPYQVVVGSTVSEIISEWDRIFSLKTWQK